MASTQGGTVKPMSISAASSAVFLLVVASSLLAVPVAASPDVDALAALRKGLSDPEGVLNSWDTTLVDPCTWFHITCDDNTKRVIRIDLSNLKLSGPLVPELGNLEQLKYMELQMNNIHGIIPDEIGNLQNLISLDLYKNNISSDLPVTLAKLKSLVFLRVDHNQLFGAIPPEMDGMTNLRVIDLSNNDLCGPVPTDGPFKDLSPPSSLANNPRLGQTC